MESVDQLVGLLEFNGLSSENNLEDNQLIVTKSVSDYLDNFSGLLLQTELEGALSKAKKKLNLDGTSFRDYINLNRYLQEGEYNLQKGNLKEAYTVLAERLYSKHEGKNSNSLDIKYEYVLPKKGEHSFPKITTPRNAIYHKDLNKAADYARERLDNHLIKNNEVTLILRRSEEKASL